MDDDDAIGRTTPLVDRRLRRWGVGVVARGVRRRYVPRAHVIDDDDDGDAVHDDDDARRVG